MRSKGANGMCRFSVDVELANNHDLALMCRGLLQPDQVRHETIPGVVDSGAAMLVLPQAVVKRSSSRTTRGRGLCSGSALRRGRAAKGNHHQHSQPDRPLAEEENPGP